MVRAQGRTSKWKTPRCDHVQSKHASTVLGIALHDEAQQQYVRPVRHRMSHLLHLAKQNSATPMFAMVTVVGRKGMAPSAAVDTRRAACVRIRMLRLVEHGQASVAG